MTDEHGSNDRLLRAVGGGSGGSDGSGTRNPPPSRDPTAALREALGALDAKMRSPDAATDLGRWLETVENVVAEISTTDLDATREEIRILIDQLLELNAQVQNLVRLKQLLS